MKFLIKEKLFTVEGELTFGAMLAIQYIVGQPGALIEQLIGYIQNAQDAKISMERLNNIHEMEDEELADKNYMLRLPPQQTIRNTGIINIGHATRYKTA